MPEELAPIYVKLGSEPEDKDRWKCFDELTYSIGEDRKQLGTVGALRKLIDDHRKKGES